MDKVLQSSGIRRAAVAGLFYSKDPDRLRQDVADLLAAAPSSGASAVKAIIAPHAGYVYSGSVAGAAFAALRGQAAGISRVIVIGPAHYVALRGIAVPTVEAFETPLGRLPIDHAALAALGDLPFVQFSNAPHAPEHALEVELPFVQTLIPACELVPIVVGDAKPAEVAQALDRLWGQASTLIVISSDLSHYHDYDTAYRLDRDTAALIEAGAWAELDAKRACGYLPIAGLLVETTRRGLASRRLALCNSGDSAGDRTRVVGYGAWAFGAQSH
jgi:MEMO1 family protein